MNRTGLKYYLRALGIGIIVTALLMGYSQKGQAQMTDEEIRERAAQLGMREQQGVLSELATASPEVSPAADPTVSPTYWSTAASTGSPTSQPAAEPAASPTPQPAASLAPAGDVVTLVINRGESSVTVSKNLEELGLVEDYWAFDRYLCENGFDHSIGTGTYEIPLGTAEEEIARIICNLR